MVIMMEEPFDSPIDQTKMATAILVTCVVEALAETDPNFQKRFVEKVGKAYQDARGKTGTDCLGTLVWVRQMLDADDLWSILHPDLSE